jgi:glycosyltransferase involved in cell wall biosynthesis
MKSNNKTKRKILITVDKMGIGGTEKLTAALANSFAKKGYDCLILILFDNLLSIKFVDKDKVKICTAFRKYKYDPFYLFKIRKIIRDYKPDIILCQALFSYFSVKIATLLSHAIPMFLALHYTHSIKIKDKIFDRIYFALLRLTSDKIITIYRRQNGLFSSKYHLPLRKFICIPNGIDTGYFKNTNMKNNKRKLHITHIANIREEKDQATLLEALKILEENLKEWRLTFCGRDLIHMKHEFIKRLSSWNLQQKVVFIDCVDDVKTLLIDADIFILSSISEALPMSALEAMSMGVPCILTDVGGCSDIVDDGINGFLIPQKNPQAIADRVLFLANNPDQLRKMRIEARKKIVREFDLERIVGRYIDLFEKHLQKEEA